MGSVDRDPVLDGLSGFWYELRLDNSRALLMRMETSTFRVGNVVTLYGDEDGAPIPICELILRQTEWERLVMRGRLVRADQPPATHDVERRIGSGRG